MVQRCSGDTGLDQLFLTLGYALPLFGPGLNGTRLTSAVVDDPALTQQNTYRPFGIRLDGWAYLWNSRHGMPLVSEGRQVGMLNSRREFPHCEGACTCEEISTMRNPRPSVGLTYLFTVLLTVGGCQSERSSPLQRAVDTVWSDAAIGSDTEYQKLINNTPAQAIAPDDMRRLICAWPSPRSLRNWPQQLQVDFNDGRMTFTWNAEIASGVEAKAARQRFATELAKRGYQSVSPQERETFGEKFIANRGEVQSRKQGETELFVWFDALPYTGAHLTGAASKWVVRCPYRLPPPRLAEALGALPDWTKVTYLNESFFSALADEPILAISSDPNIKYGHAFSIFFVNPVRQKLVDALEASGFKYQQEQSPHRDGGTQKTWYRYTDITYAHVITSSDGQGLRFTCQRPQHAGEPIKTKPLPLHPSLRFPREKRPILKLEELNFAAPRLKRQAQLFQTLAESLAKKDWHVQGFKDERYSVEPRYSASWQTSVVTSTDYLPKVRPYHGVTIFSEGRVVHGADRLQTLSVQGVLVPLCGWSARVSYGLSPNRQGRLMPSLSAVAGKVGEYPIPYSFSYALQLTSRSVSVSERDSQEFQCAFKSNLPQLDFKRALHRLYSTPEALRDEVLADIATLRQQVQTELESGKTIELYDMHDVRSDNPPRRTPRSDSSAATAETRQKLLAAVENQFIQEEATIRVYFRELHAAVQQALPLATVKDELLAEPPK